MLGPALDRSTKLWFDARILVGTMDQQLNEKQYVFGFHPHGLYPVTSVWCHYSSQVSTLKEAACPKALARATSAVLLILRTLAPTREEGNQ